MDSVKNIKLSEICSLITKGTTPTTLGFSFQESGVKFLKIECFDENGDFVKDKLTYISEECNEKLRRSKIQENDILFSIAGAIGRVSIVDKSMLPANTNQALAIIRIDREDIYIPYIKLILTSNIVKKQFEKQKQGVAQINLSLKNIGDLVIPICSVNKQIEYVNLFDEIKSVISNHKQQLEQLDLLIKARFVEMFGDPIKNTNGWKTEKLSTVCNAIYGGGTPSKAHPEYFDGNIPWVSPKDMKSLIITDSIDHITAEAVENSSAKMVPAGAVLMVIRSGILKHSLPVALAAVDLTVNQDMKVFISGDKIKSEFLMFYFKAIEQDILSGVRGVTADNIDFKEFQNRMVIVPPIEAQEVFSTFVAQVDKSKLLEQKHLTKHSYY